MRLLILICTLAGCVYDVPLAVSPREETCQAAVQKGKTQAKIGIYLNDDLRKYAYKRKMMGMTFRMNIGESLAPILTEMGAAKGA